MDESYEILFEGKKGICILFPSLRLSAERLRRIINSSGYTLCLINYAGFENSHGSFPGENIIQNVNDTMENIKLATGKKIVRIIGDSYGGLIALGLLSKYRVKYGKIKTILTSPLISFERHDKNPESPHSNEGFIRYLKRHRRVRRINPQQLKNLIEHKEIPDPFKADIPTKNLRIFHYDKDRSLKYSVSDEFSKLKNVKIIKLRGYRHSLINFEGYVLTKIFA